MLSTSSLQAFSGATTTGSVSGKAPVDRTQPVMPARLVRSQPQAAAPIPGAAPAIPPPRGSLLNLSV